MMFLWAQNCSYWTEAIHQILDFKEFEKQHKVLQCNLVWGQAPSGTYFEAPINILF